MRVLIYYFDSATTEPDEKLKGASEVLTADGFLIIEFENGDQKGFNVSAIKKYEIEDNQ